MLIPFTPYVSALKYESYQTVKKSEPIVRVKKSEPYEAVVKHEPVAKYKSVVKSEPAPKYESVEKLEHTSAPPSRPLTNRFPIAIAGRSSVEIQALLMTPPQILKRQIPAYTLKSIHGCGFPVITLRVYVRFPDHALWRTWQGKVVLTQRLSSGQDTRFSTTRRVSLWRAGATVCPVHPALPSRNPRRGGHTRNVRRDHAPQAVRAVRGWVVGAGELRGGPCMRTNRWPNTNRWQSPKYVVFIARARWVVLTRAV